MSKRKPSLIGKIHHQDCLAGFSGVVDESIDLVFADPPFNIGYEYDEYDDRLEAEKYIAWSGEWMSEVHRTLKSNGSFWLAIGDEYAAELKIEAQRVGFHCRSWVIWYYTFGVHCQKKFTRSHAHLFHFVKDETDFVFNDQEVRVPSARQLVYNDARANPRGRMPDDTWILRPQELVDGFQCDEDVWYFPRVAGTFKERAGFHGCQMPEQLLGRILRSCSNEGDIVVDPFSGSGTTLAVAKKLGRQFFGFELSQDYAKLGTQRLDSVSVGDRLDGGEEPKVGKTATKPAKRKLQADQLELFPLDAAVEQELASEADGLLESFEATNRGYSVDRLVADPVLNEDFQLACDRRSLPGTIAERNRFLFRLRKAGRIKRHGINTTVPTRVDWGEINSYIFASEIAWRQLSNRYCNLSLDEIFCDPRLATQFDEIAASFSPGYQPLDYRWAALKLRKEGSNAKRRAAQRTPRQLGITGLNNRNLKNQAALSLTDLNLQEIHDGPGVYLIKEADGSCLYAGESEQLRNRIQTQFGSAQPRECWLRRSESLQLYLLPVDSTIDYRFARQSLLLKWHQPMWNQVEKLAA